MGVLASGCFTTWPLMILQTVRLPGLLRFQYPPPKAEREEVVGLVIAVSAVETNLPPFCCSVAVTDLARLFTLPL